VEEAQLLLRAPDQNAVINLHHLSPADRRAYASALLAALADLKRKTGRPHWIVLDDSMDLLAAAGGSAWTNELNELDVMFVSHDTRHMQPLLPRVSAVLGVGACRPQFEEIAALLGVEPPEIEAGTRLALDVAAWLVNRRQAWSVDPGREPDETLTAKVVEPSKQSAHQLVENR
jgi:hypothetical protein